MSDPDLDSCRTTQQHWDLHQLYDHLHQADQALRRHAACQAADPSRQVVVVSACLLGERCRYDGTDNYRPEAVVPVLKDPHITILPLCPEVLGGMGCPRPPVHFAAGDGRTLLTGQGQVVDQQGHDHTVPLTRGAQMADDLAMAAGATRAILKERSPSCGARAVHGPQGVKPGLGAFAARLAERGVTLLTEEDFA